MKVTISHFTACERHPEAVERIVAKVRRGRSQLRDTEPASWEWFYEWATRGRGFTLKEVLNGTAQAARQKQPMTLNELVADEMERSKPICLVGALPRTRAHSVFDPDFCPPEVEARVRAGHVERLQENARVAGLSPGARQAEFDDALAHLRTQPGFVEIRKP